MSLPTDRIDFTVEIERCRTKLMAYILAIVRDYHLAQDVFQETLLVAAQSTWILGEIRNPLALAREIARRRALAALREKRRHVALPSEEMLDLLDRACEAECEAELDRAPVSAEALAECLRQLPASWRQIVALRYWDGYEVNEIASRLERSASAISVSLHRIRNRLSQCLAFTQKRRRSV